MSEHYFRVAVLGNKNATPVSSRFATLPEATVRGRTMQTMPRYRQRVLVIKEYARRHSGCVGVAIHDIEQEPAPRRQLVRINGLLIVQALPGEPPLTSADVERILQEGS